MNKKAVIPILALIALLIVPVMAMGDMDMMDGKATAGSDGALGYQYTHADGDRPSQFGAYRDVNKGFVFESLHLKGEWNDPARPYYFIFDGKDLGQDDQVLKAGMGRYGNFRLDFKWTEYPRLYASGVRFVEGYSGNGRYTISPLVQTALDPINGVTPYVNFDPAPGSAMRTAVMGLVNSASGTDLRVDRERGTLDYLQKLAPGLNLRVNYTHDYKEGTKLSSTGVYQRATFN
ncbi:MAG: MtrB/PioB family outer membrane beta-barrel protein, partial [Nitrospirae bacterium]|nr:MtrB/PioB family outer membrane beta-barrel protein [Nitrospirota bacterium]